MGRVHQWVTLNFIKECCCYPNPLRKCIIIILCSAVSLFSSITHHSSMIASMQCSGIDIGVVMVYDIIIMKFWFHWVFFPSAFFCLYSTMWRMLVLGGSSLHYVQWRQIWFHGYLHVSNILFIDLWLYNNLCTSLKFHGDLQVCLRFHRRLCLNIIHW